MAKVTRVKAARTDIWSRGVRTPADNKQGFTWDRSRPADANDILLVKAGEPYYWWQLHRSPKQLSLTKPRQSQLTNSAFLGEMYGLQEEIEDWTGTKMHELEEQVQAWKDKARELAEMSDESLQAMPESLQYGPTGEMLQERYDACEAFEQELDNIEFEIDDEEDWKTEWCLQSGEGNMEEEWIEYEQERVEEVLSEIQGLTLEVY